MRKLLRWCRSKCKESINSTVVNNGIYEKSGNLIVLSKTKVGNIKYYASTVAKSIN